MSLMLKNSTTSNNNNNVDINFLMRFNSLKTFSNVIVEIDLKFISIDFVQLNKGQQTWTTTIIKIIFNWMVAIVHKIQINFKCYRFQYPHLLHENSQIPLPLHHHSHRLYHPFNKIMQSKHYSIEKQITTISKPIYCQHLHFVTVAKSNNIQRMTIENRIIIEVYIINQKIANSPSIAYKIVLKFKTTALNGLNAFDDTLTNTELWSFSSVIKLLFIFLALCLTITTTTHTTATLEQFNGAIKNKKQIESSTKSVSSGKTVTTSTTTSTTTTKLSSQSAAAATVAPTTTITEQNEDDDDDDGNLMKMCTKVCARTETHIRNLLNVSSIRIRRKTSIILLKNHLSFLVITFLICSPICAIKATTTTQQQQQQQQHQHQHNMKYSSNIVKTKYGELRGIIVRNNPTVEAYLGVPYATPPVGSLR